MAVLEAKTTLEYAQTKIPRLIRNIRLEWLDTFRSIGSGPTKSALRRTCTGHRRSTLTIGIITTAFAKY
jgi:hypothetical protein